MVGKVTPDDQASASLLPAIMGISKYASPNDALIGCITAIRGLPREDIGNESMEWGNKFEVEILKEAALRLGLDNLDVDHQQPYQHREWPLACSLDGTAFGRGLRIEHNPEAGIYVMGEDAITLDGIGVLEAKLTASDAEDSPPLWRGPVQLQAQMAIIGATWGAVCTLYRGTALRVYLFRPHSETLALVKRTVETFQKKLDNFRETGAIDYYPPQDSADAVRMYPVVEEDAEPILMDDQGEQLAESIFLKKKKIKELQAEIADDEKDLMDLMGTNGLALTERYQIAWPSRHYQAKPAYTVAATEARTVRQSTLTIKERKK